MELQETKDMLVIDFNMEDNKTNFLIPNMSFSYQDEGKTLKIFYGDNESGGINQDDIEYFNQNKGTVTRLELISKNGREYVKHMIKHLDIIFDIENKRINFYIK